MQRQSRQHDIHTRRVRFGIHHSIPKNWNDDCPIKTYIFNAITMLAPAFERLAITSVLPYKDKISNTTLNEQVKGFIGQESSHGSEFIRMQSVLKSQGYDPRQVEKTNVKRFLAISNRLSADMHLSFTLAAEHVTAVISDLILTDSQWLAKAHPQVAALWRWHAIEEIDHKAVVFDLYQSLGLGYWTRIKGMLWMTFVLNSFLLANYCHLAKKDGRLFNLKFWAKTFWVLWGKPGFIRKQLGAFFKYFLPSFHPWQKNNHSLIEPFKKAYAENPGLNVIDYLNKEFG